MQKIFVKLTSFIEKLAPLIVMCLPSVTFASGDTPVSDGLHYVINAMYGATGVAVATIAVMIVGLLCLGHLLKWSVLGYTIIGISIIFGAGSIVSGITALVTHV